MTESRRLDEDGSRVTLIDGLNTLTMKSVTDSDEISFYVRCQMNTGND